MTTMLGRQLATRALRILTLAVASALACLSLTACGGGSSTNTTASSTSTTTTPSAENAAEETEQEARYAHTPVVVEIGKYQITQGALEHSMETGPVKKEVPHPPHYAACVSTLKKSTPPKGGKSPSTAELEAACKGRYEQEKVAALGFLIATRWVLGEASELGFTVGDAEVKHLYDEDNSKLFKKPGSFKAYLKTSGQTPADLLLGLKRELAEEKIRHAITPTSGDVQAEVENFIRNWRTKWISRTNCHRNYVVPKCKQYKSTSVLKEDPYTLN